MTTLDAVLDQAMELPWRDRARLIEELVRRLDPPGDEVREDDWQQAWSIEIRERLAAADRGEFDPRPWREVCDDIRAGLGPVQ